jgi:hypothetical protein
MIGRNHGRRPWIGHASHSVGGALCPRWTSENQPYVDPSKAANGAEPEQEYLYPAEPRSMFLFAESNGSSLYWLHQDGNAGMPPERVPVEPDG